MCPVEGIGRAFATHIGGHWRGIGGHWRALATKMRNKPHIALDNPFPKQHTKRNGKTSQNGFVHVARAPSGKIEKLGDLNII